jgi:hypothetical protein
VNFGHVIKAIWRVLICHGLAASVRRQINLGSFDSFFGVLCRVKAKKNVILISPFIAQHNVDMIEPVNLFPIFLFFFVCLYD